MLKNIAIGFEQLKDHVKNFTPEWAYGITTIKPDLIRKTAKEMADASPAVIVHPGSHVTWYGDDTQRVRAIAILNALLGSWGREEDFTDPENLTAGYHPHPAFQNRKKLERCCFRVNILCQFSRMQSSYMMPQYLKIIRDYQIKGWIVNGTNLIHTIPIRQNTLKAIQNLDLLVAVDTMPMEITGWADVVLRNAPTLNGMTVTDQPSQ